ncbi:MAG TPA: hypothetical protein VFS44_02320 [Gemmatimonadaceae bacterium]|nr:hypothetical protein [Gemmatimonadaceae bacterium]
MTVLHLVHEPAHAAELRAMGQWLARQAARGPLVLSAEQAVRLAHLLTDAADQGVATRSVTVRQPEARA